MRISTLILALLVTFGAGGCQACVEASGIEVISEEDEIPLPALPIGPRGMPPLVPLAPKAGADGAGVSSCSDGDARERDHAAYVAERNRGLSRRMRGKVGVIDLRIASAAAEPWTPLLVRRADLEAANARAFILQAAVRSQVTDLSLDIVPWTVTTDLARIDLPTDARGRADWGAVDALRARVLDTVRSATGVSVVQAARALKAKGYAEVAVMVRLPTTRIIREFATASDAAGLEVAFVQQPGQRMEPGTYVHELLHLFGADDLYRLHDRDARDEGDVMGGPCGGALQRATIADATAWAIGWRDAPPERLYAIGGRRAHAQKPLDL